MTFGSQVKKATIKVKGDAEKSIRGTLLGIFSNTVRGTPVDTGRLRNNWFASIGGATNISFAGKGTNESPESANRSMKNAQSVTSNFRLGDTVYFSNNLPYAYITEYGGVVKGKRRSGNFMMTQAILNASKG